MAENDPKSSGKASPKHRRFESLAICVWGVGTLIFSLHIAAYPFLIYLYGFGRVRSESLHFITMTKGGPWIVSNGDQVTHKLFIHFLMSGAIWLVLFFVTFPVVYRLLPKRKKQSGD